MNRIRDFPGAERWIQPKATHAYPRVTPFRWRPVVSTCPPIQLGTENGKAARTRRFFGRHRTTDRPGQRLFRASQGRGSAPGGASYAGSRHGGHSRPALVPSSFLNLLGPFHRCTAGAGGHRGRRPGVGTGVHNTTRPPRFRKP